MGKNLVPKLAQKFESVTVIAQERERNIFSGLDNVRILIGDIKNEGFLQRALKKKDICFHLASFKRNFKYHTENPGKVFWENEEISHSFFKSVFESSLKNLIVMGSAAVYAPKDSFISESDPLNLESQDAYALSKISAENGARVLSYSRPDMSIVLVRSDNFYGEKDNFGPEAQVLPSLIRKSIEDEEIVVWGSGRQKRTFIFVEDVCDALIRLGKLKKGFYVFNISTGEKTDFKKIIKIIKKIVKGNKKVIFDTSKPEGASCRLVSAEKIKKELKWKPKYNLEKGLEKAIRYYLENKN